MGDARYCHCYPVFKCEPAVAEAQGPDGVWFPVCQRCQDISFDAGLFVRKLQRRPLNSLGYYGDDPTQPVREPEYR